MRSSSRSGAPTMRWPRRQRQEALTPTGLRVRMGIHTGEPLVGETGYVGMDVHRAARVMSAGHGGQVLVSGRLASCSTTGSSWPTWSEHRLKDLLGPAAAVPSRLDRVPALKTLHRTNLPVASTPLVGRTRELEEAGPCCATTASSRSPRAGRLGEDTACAPTGRRGVGGVRRRRVLDPASGRLGPGARLADDRAGGRAPKEPVEFLAGRASCCSSTTSSRSSTPLRS